jgi:hypothetical protein
MGYLSNRWFVVKDKDKQGPFSAEEIRSALRDGRVMPFDMVVMEGSLVKRILVEVDEIFDQPNVQYKEAEYAPAAPQQEFGGNNGDVATRINKKAPVETLAVNPRKILQKAALAESFEEKAKRIYFVDDRTNKKILGPYHPKEIANLVQGGFLDKHARVYRQDQPRRIGIAKFYKRYIDAERRGADVGEIRPRISDTIIEYAANRGIGVPVLSLGALIIGLGIGFIILMNVLPGKSRFGRGIDRDRSHTSMDSDDFEAPEPIVIRPKAPIERADSGPLVITPRKTPAPVVRKTPAPRRTPARVSRYVPPRRASRPPPRATVRPQAPLPKPTQRVVAVARPPARSQPAAPPRSSGQTLAGKEGKVVSLSGMRFNPAELEQCGLKCKLNMADNSGNRVTAVFFKAQFAQELKNNPNGARVSGMLQKDSSGYVLYLKK